MATIKEAMSKIESHEKECAIRYENIEKDQTKDKTSLKDLKI